MASEQTRLCLYAQRDPDGALRGTFLIVEGTEVGLWEESGLGEELALPLPQGALEAVFRRYGKPLESDSTTGEPPLYETLLAEPVPEEPELRPLRVPLRAGRTATLRRFRFMPFGWVHPADYLLCELPEEEPLAAPAPLVASALAALARAASR
jgi:hypothetical protein